MLDACDNVLLLRLQPLRQDRLAGQTLRERHREKRAGERGSPSPSPPAEFQRASSCVLGVVARNAFWNVFGMLSERFLNTFSWVLALCKKHSKSVP